MVYSPHFFNFHLLRTCTFSLPFSIEYASHTIVSYDPAYLDGDSNIILNNCNDVPTDSGDHINCNSAVTIGACSNGAPLTVRCEEGKEYVIINV